jgi:hypothetical protein
MLYFIQLLSCTLHRFLGFLCNAKKKKYSTYFDSQEKFVTQLNLKNNVHDMMMINKSNNRHIWRHLCPCVFVASKRMSPLVPLYKACHSLCSACITTHKLLFYRDHTRCHAHDDSSLSLSLGGREALWSPSKRHARVGGCIWDMMLHLT